jgi:uncharacterized repeat protein (TIGR03917 family)
MPRRVARPVLRRGRRRKAAPLSDAVQPGACAADVSAALEAIPLDATYVEVHDDIDTVMVFRVTPPAAAPVLARPAGPDAPAPALPTLVTAA